MKKPFSRPTPLPFVIGRDLAGTVTAERLYHLPEGVGPEAAAAVARTAGPAWIGLYREARLGAGETIVAGGGGGGVGSAAVQMAAACGGTLRPRIGARLSLADSAKAHSRQESGNTGGGRILVTSG